MSEFGHKLAHVLTVNGANHHELGYITPPFGMRPQPKRLRIVEDRDAAPAERVNGNQGAAKRTPPRDETPTGPTRRNGTRPAGTAKSDSTSADARAGAAVRISRVG